MIPSMFNTPNGESTGQLLHRDLLYLELVIIHYENADMRYQHRRSLLVHLSTQARRNLVIDDQLRDTEIMLNCTLANDDIHASTSRLRNGELRLSVDWTNWDDTPHSP
jgi:hypothetical protein